jgi:hypothetical protein
MKQKLLCALLLLAAANTHAQYQDHIWYFGNSTAGMSFDANNVPSSLNNKYTPFGAEGCFVATNPNTGELMFYTSGNTIINKNHVLMQNGNLVFPAPAPVVQPANGPFNSSVNGAQSVAVIEKPNSVATGQCGHFLYFINDANEWGASGKPGSLYMGEIDMNANSGLGSVTQQPVRIISNAFTESMMVIAKSDNQGAWIILNSVLTNQIEVYAVTAAGTVNTTPVSSFTVPGVNWAATWGTQNAALSWQLIGSMAYNQPTGKFAIAQSYGGQYQLYIGDFNSTTGVLSNVTIRENFTGATYTAYGTEFSPSGNWLYNSVAANTAGAGAVRAYNMQTSTDISNINGPNGWAGLLYNGLKAGPDGRLWVNTNNYGSDPLPARVVRSTFDIENPVALGFVSFTLPVNTFSYRFPDFLSLTPPPVSVDDQEVIINCTDTTVTTLVLINDTNSAAGNLFVDHIVDTPLHGTAQLVGDSVVYSLTDLSFVGIDTVSYLIRSDVSCLAPGKISRLLVEVTQCPRDYGDAPNSYNTNIASNGAAHNVVPGLQLGALAPDIDTNGMMSVNAQGDNLDGTDDEDGISSFPVIAGGTTNTITNYTVVVNVTNMTGTPASLCGWIDWNLNGQFDASESVCTTAVSGVNTLTWPSATLTGPVGSTGTFARFRLSTDTVKNSFPTGVVADGEVEDYFISFTTPLPLTVTAFEATKKGETVLLNWKADNEQALTGFIVERSGDGSSFESLGTLNVRQAHDHENYTYTDNIPMAGNNYYRLKINETDGGHSYSVVRLVQFGALQNDIVIYPNPVTDNLMVTKLEKGMQIKLLAPDGRILLTKNVSGHTESISMESIAAGLYMLQVSKEEVVIQTFKINKK